MVYLNKMITTLALLGGVSMAKEHYINDEVVVASEHQRVQASSKIIELCFFDDTVDKINDSTNKMCATIGGDLRVGFEWIQNFEAYNKVQQSGKMELSLNFYSKQSLRFDPIIKLDKLFEQQMSLNLNEFYIQHASAINYHIYKTMLCLDVKSEIQEYQVIIQNNIKFIECIKVLVDCLFDFGQFAVTDTLKTTKPYGPFSKVLDECKLGTS